MEFLFFSILGLGFWTFLYFGYRNDYKRNLKEFLTTIFGVLFMGVLFLLVRLTEIPTWLPFLLIMFFALLYWFKSRANPFNKK